MQLSASSLLALLTLLPWAIAVPAPAPKADFDSEGLADRALSIVTVPGPVDVVTIVKTFTSYATQGEPALAPAPTPPAIPHIVAEAEAPPAPVDAAAIPPPAGPPPPAQSAPASPPPPPPSATATSPPPPPPPPPPPVASSSAPPPAAASAANPPSGGSGPTGLGIDSTGWSALAGSGVGWYWNWGLDAFHLPGIEFVPTVWGTVDAGQVGEKTFPEGTTHILSFNEPDMTTAVGGSAIDAVTAATLHQQWTGSLTGVNANLMIGAPAVARGSTAWFNNWITACAGKCKFDFVPIHFYGTDANDLISYVKSFPAQGKPIWITEFACWDTTQNIICTATQSEQFMRTAIDWFRESGGMVERWSWFGALPDKSGDGYGLENANGSLNELGKEYIKM